MRTGTLFILAVLVTQSFAAAHAEETQKEIENFAIDGIKLGMFSAAFKSRCAPTTSKPRTRDVTLNVDVDQISGYSKNTKFVDGTFHDGKLVCITVLFEEDYINRKYKTQDAFLDAQIKTFGKFSDDDSLVTKDSFYAKWDLKENGLFAETFSEDGGVYFLFGKKSCEPQLPARTDKFSPREVMRIQQLTFLQTSIGMSAKNFATTHKKAVVISSDKSSGVLVEKISFTPKFAPEPDDVTVTIVDGEIVEFEVFTATVPKTIRLLRQITQVIGKSNQTFKDGESTFLLWNLTGTGRSATLVQIGNGARFTFGLEEK